MVDQAILDRAIRERREAIDQREEAVKMLGQLALLKAAVDERLKRAYTLLVSVQPAAHRQTLASTNDTAMRLHLTLERAIQEWVDEYLRERDA